MLLHKCIYVFDELANLFVFPSIAALVVGNPKERRDEEGREVFFVHIIYTRRVLPVSSSFIMTF